MSFGLNSHLLSENSHPLAQLSHMDTPRGKADWNSLSWTVMFPAKTQRGLHWRGGDKMAE